MQANPKPRSLCADTAVQRAVLALALAPYPHLAHDPELAREIDCGDAVERACLSQSGWHRLARMPGRLYSADGCRRPIRAFGTPVNVAQRFGETCDAIASWPIYRRKRRPLWPLCTAQLSG